MSGFQTLFWVLSLTIRYLKKLSDVGEIEIQSKAILIILQELALLNHIKDEANNLKLPHNLRKMKMKTKTNKTKILLSLNAGLAICL